MTTKQAIIEARKHLGTIATMESSARLCLQEAVIHYDAGQYDAARKRAAKSLAYSVGIGHPSYQKAAGKDSL